MKNLTKLAPSVVFFFASLFTTLSAQAQNVYFTDIHLKTVLLSNPTVNSNGDNEIQKTEATSFSGSLNLSNSGIWDMTGIEYFTNMVALNVSNNQLTSINLYSNTSLVSLDCSNNSIEELHVETLTELRSLNASSNALTEINLTNNNLLMRFYCAKNNLEDLYINENTALMGLNCSSNALTSLDVSANSELVMLDCSDNSLSSLNMANNNNINIASSSFNAIGNDLNCIKVDDKGFSDQNWSNKIDASSFFSNSCTAVLPAKDVFTGGITVFPNPTTKNVTITFDGNNDNVSLKVYNSAGKVVMQEQYQDRKSATLEMNVAAGIYMVAVDNGQSVTTHKLVKQ